MFTGIIAKTSNVKNVKLSNDGMILEVANSFGRLKNGESICVNGVCSTVKKWGKTIVFEYMPETLKVSNVRFLKVKDVVNLEQSMKLGDRLDGHIVLGHTDAMGKIISIKNEGNSKVFEVSIPADKFSHFLVYKGCVAIEGISLTVAKVLKKSFLVKIIPFTLKNTNLKNKKSGDLVNIEFDILAKYATQR